MRRAPCARPVGAIPRPWFVTCKPGFLPPGWLRNPLSILCPVRYNDIVLLRLEYLTRQTRIDVHITRVQKPATFDFRENSRSLGAGGNVFGVEVIKRQTEQVLVVGRSIWLRLVGAILAALSLGMIVMMGTLLSEFPTKTIFFSGGPCSPGPAYRVVTRLGHIPGLLARMHRAAEHSRVLSAETKYRALRHAGPTPIRLEQVGLPVPNQPCPQRSVRRAADPTRSHDQSRTMRGSRPDNCSIY